MWLFITTWLDLYQGLSLVSLKSMAKLPWTSTVMGLHPKWSLKKTLICKICPVQDNCFAVKVAVSTLPHCTFLTLVILNKYIPLSSVSPASLKWVKSMKKRFERAIAYTYIGLNFLRTRNFFCLISMFSSCKSQCMRKCLTFKDY